MPYSEKLIRSLWQEMPNLFVILYYYKGNISLQIWWLLQNIVVGTTLTPQSSLKTSWPST